MPEYLVALDLLDDRLVQLALPEGGGTYPFQILYRTANPLGPAGTWLVQKLADAMAGKDRRVYGWRRVLDAGRAARMKSARQVRWTNRAPQITKAPEQTARQQ